MNVEARQESRRVAALRMVNESRDRHVDRYTEALKAFAALARTWVRLPNQTWHFPVSRPAREPAGTTPTRGQ